MGQLSTTAREHSAVASGQADADREKRILEDSLITLQEKNRRLEAQLERWRKELTEARAELDEAHHTVEGLQSREQQNARLLRANQAGQGAADASSTEAMCRLEEENKDLRAELSSFDPAFWEEIEDLKYREHESKQNCRKYERMLTELSRQYGFPFQAPARAR